MLTRVHALHAHEPMRPRADRAVGPEYRCLRREVQTEGVSLIPWSEGWDTKQNPTEHVQPTLPAEALDPGSGDALRAVLAAAGTHTTECLTRCTRMQRNSGRLTYDPYDGPDTTSVHSGTCSFGKPPGLAPSCIPRLQLLRVSMDPPDAYPVVVSGL
eukprot:COSAG06_NODE_238_length_19422_cov_16.417741_2_plen_157_part_00